MFTRWAYEDIEVMGHTFHRGDQVGLLWPPRTATPASGTEPARFNPSRPPSRSPPSARACTSASARRSPGWNCRSRCRSSSGTTRSSPWPQSREYADVYHFHGLRELRVTA
jgi:hypothetical protein